MSNCGSSVFFDEDKEVEEKIAKELLRKISIVREELISAVRSNARPSKAELVCTKILQNKIDILTEDNARLNEQLISVRQERVIENDLSSSVIEKLKNEVKNLRSNNEALTDQLINKSNKSDLNTSLNSSLCRKSPKSPSLWNDDPKEKERLFAVLSKQI